MPFTNDQRAALRLYMGMPKLFSRSNAVFENAMDAIDGIQDGGSTQARMISALNQLAAIDAQIISNSSLMLATEVADEVKFDAIRNDAGLRRVGRSIIQQLSIPLSMDPQADYFGAAPIGDGRIYIHDVQ